MSNQPTTPPRRPDTTGPAKGKNPPPPANRRISRPLEAKVEPRNNDRFGLYFILAATALILLFGAGVFFLRSNRSVTPVVPTASPTELVVVGTVPVVGGFESPIPNFTPPPSPTPPAPDAVSSGPYAAADPLESVVQAVTQANLPAKLPPQIPQAQLDLSEASLNFGSPAAGQLPSGIITLANPSGVDLVINGLYSNCECVAATAEAKRLKSGERTRLNIRYNPSLDSGTGQVSHILSIVSTSGQEPQIDITLSATLP